ncbi:MAG TPA: phosphate ABC transporter permease PstA [Phycicoccus elongatus]|jgi:phosphate transport system permease protein|uniref:phosphate ABC transporter permease PstA n=1 Tax=Phycicoccus elongatus TaxID=101689 RepID=UPI002B639869|nr:phosphate ABC transporter permease PstA [Phycicoccus elongatus]MCA0323053.1 phosphate ABC transporter permease PstA [Actinomycetota bacterium]HPK12702.1 phosphate ABC transporter permease PstA [Phycicoccus elongatus]HPQ73975.1 phosphate ABC transporter permease PstA [Phycicoccus elongatus]
MSTVTHVGEESTRAKAVTLPDMGGKSSGRAIKDQAARIVMWSAFVIACVPLVWILVSTLLKGGHMLASVDWWTLSQNGITARREGGGAAHAIQGTLIQGAVTALMSVPIGVLTAIYLVEYGRGRFAKAVSFMVDILTGVPSIVAALFIYALWVTTFGFQRVPFAVTLALVLLMIPTIVRSTEEMLKLVPNELREASYALGVPKWKTIVSIVLPTAFSGIVTGILLGLARVMGETAPLIILGPYTKSMASNLFDGLMGTLPTMINQDRTEALQPAVDRVWGAALTLILIVFVLNLLGRFLGRFSKVS